VTAAPVVAPKRRSSTPRSVRRLRRLQLVAVALLLAFGALAVTALAVSYNAAVAATGSLSQYNRLADARIQALGVQQAANTWAVAPSAATRSQVGARLADLAGTLADATGNAEDRDRIVPLTGALVSYGMTLRDALNADGAASAAILAKADAQLATEILAPLETATAAAADRVAAELATNWLPLVIGGVILAGGGLAAVLVALARASHRYLNLGVAAGLLCALVSVAVVGATTSTASATAASFTGESRPDVDALTTARQHLHQARADELLAIGLKGVGTKYQERWTAGYDAGRKALAQVPESATALADLASYRSAHLLVTAATGKSQWDTAASVATGDGRAAQAFERLDTDLDRLNSSLRGPLNSRVGSVSSVIAAAIAGVLVLTLAGAALATWGVSRRIEEYR